MSVTKGGRRIPTPMPPPKDAYHSNRSTPKLVGSDASYKLNHYEIEALNAVKATAPKMDRSGYFFYVTSTAKKKKISLMQPKPPRVAFVDKRRPGVAERIECEPRASVAPTATEYAREDPMTQRGPSPAPRARLYTQLESYQPRYHTIRESSDKKVDSECRRRKKDQRIVGPTQSVLSASGMFALAGADDFYAIMRKKTASLLCRLCASSNSILKTIAGRFDSHIMRHLIQVHVSKR